MPIIVDGSLADWLPSDRIDDGLVQGFQVFATSDATDFIFAIKAPVAIGANSTVWLNTDRNATTGYQIFGFAGGAEFNVNFGSGGVPALYSGAAGGTLVLGNLTYAYSADSTAIEFRIPKSAVGNPNAIDTLYDINDASYLPSSYSSTPFTVYNNTGIVTAADSRIGIVYSQTTANNYFSATAYADLFMAVQSQAMQAGISFDILTEADLTNLTTLAKYDALVFPSFRNVPAAQANAIANTLQQATQQYDLGIVTGGEFMTNDENGAALAGNSYSRMATLLDVTRITGGNGANVTVKASDAGSLVLKGYGSGEIVEQYQAVGWTAFGSVSGNGTTIATETVAGQDYAAAIATQTGGRNVVFSTPGIMADANMLQDAISYAANGSAVTVALHMTRGAGIVATRVDMDQSQELSEVNPPGSAPGIYDQMLPVISQWKSAYNFVGSYYVNIGDGTNGTGTDWAVSLPYYKALIDLGGEIGTHSYTHPADTNTLTTAQLQYQFQQSAAVLSQQLSTFLGSTYTIAGAALPGAPETLATSLAIMPYVNNYLSGGWTGVGAGYPSAFGFMTPGTANKVYIAPNVTFDFTRFEFQNMTPAQVSAAWAAEWTALTAHADSPIIVWPLHDYGIAEFDTTGTGAPSPYDNQVFTDFIARAANQNMEFVTLADLAKRIQAFETATVTTTVSGNTITANVGSSSVGQFALDLSGQGSQVIKSVNNWYAYDSNSVFLPQSGGNFTVTLGAAQDDVTHITSLPMRSSLISLSGNGTNLSFTLSGEGVVVIDMTNPAGKSVNVTGATVVSQIGDILTLNVGTFGTHAVTVTQTVAGASPVITSNGGGATAAITVVENAIAVTTVTATDADSPTLTYSISGTDAARFSINATTGVLQFLAAPNFEAPTDVGANNVYDLIVTASDGGTVDTQALVVTVTNINEAPVITSNGGAATATISVAENTTAVTTVTSTDPEGIARTYTISGTDASKFSINATTGVLQFVAAPDFEAPTDVGTNNAYNLVVTASDGTLTDTQSLIVTVTNVAGITQSLPAAGGSLSGSGEEDNLTGGSGTDTLNGLSGNDTLTGNAGNDTLNGGDGNDLLVGGNGRDVMTGGTGVDTFRFANITNSAVGSAARDIINDFQTGIDLIVVSGIDANTTLGGNQAFTFLATAGASFTAPGQLGYRYEFIDGTEYTVIQGNVNTQLGADFEIALLGHQTLTSGMFAL